MKQGHADKSGLHREMKPRPIVQAIKPGFASQIGTAMDPKAITSQSDGKSFRGPAADTYKAGPGGGRTVHKHGSQGKR
jgi:hypothetical protein